MHIFGVTLACGFYNKSVKSGNNGAVVLQYIHLVCLPRGQDQAIKRPKYDKAHLKAWHMIRMWQGCHMQWYDGPFIHVTSGLFENISVVMGSI